MRLSHEQTENTVIVKIAGELGHHEAAQAVKYIEEVLDLYNPQFLQLDMEELSFMDSSGIFVVMSAFKQISEFGGTFLISNLPVQAKKVLHAAGIDKILKIS